MGAQILNDLTGEAALTDIAGRKYHLVFDLSAVMAAEKMTGKSAMDLMMSRPGVVDCVCLIIAGCSGWQRRNPGAEPKITEAKATRIFSDSGGLRIAPVLIESLSCAEGMGLEGAEPDDADDEAGPLVSPTS